MFFFSSSPSIQNETKNSFISRLIEYCKLKVCNSTQFYSIYGLGTGIIKARDSEEYSGHL
jgi:hypothetical protein